MLFPFNPRSKIKVNNKSRNNKEKHFRTSLQRYIISEGHVIYLGNKRGQTRAYESESPRLLHLVFRKMWNSCVILLNDGKPFAEDGQNVLKRIWLPQV